MSRTLFLVPVALVVLLPGATTVAGDPTLVARLGSDRFRQQERVEVIVYSPDGKQIATADRDTIHIWDAADGKKTRDITLAKHRILELRYTPDGKRILALTQLSIEIEGVTNPAPLSNRIIIEANSGKIVSEVRLPMRKGTGTISPDAAWLALIDDSQEMVQMIDAATVKVAWQHTSTGNAAESIAWHPNGNAVAIGTLGGHVVIRDCKTGKILHDYVLEEHNVLQRMVFSPDGKDIVAEVSRPDPNHVIRFEAATGKVRWKYQAIRASELAFTADGKELMFWGYIHVSGDHCSWRLLDAETGKPKPGTMYTGYGNAVAIRPDGKVVALGGYLGHISQWDLSTRKRLNESSADPPGPVSDLHFNADGSKVRGWSSGWYEWDVKTGRQTRLSPDLGIGPDDRVANSPDRKLLAIAKVAEPEDNDEGRILEFVDLESGKRKSFGRVRDQDQFQFLGDGRLAVIRDGVAIHDPKTGKKSLTIGKTGQAEVFAIGDDGKSAVALTPAGDSLRQTRWDLVADRKLDAVSCRLSDPGLMRGSGSWRVELFSAGRILAVYFSHVAHPGTPVGLDPIIEEHTALFDAHTGRYLSGWWDLQFRAQLAFSADGRSVACYYPVGLGIDLRETATGERRARIPISTHMGGCCFNSDGRLLAVANMPGPIEIWDLAGKPSEWQENKGDDCWEALRSKDADRAYEAIAVFTANSSKGIALLKQKMVLPTMPAAEAVAGQITYLDAADFRKREQATKTLADMGEIVLPRLREALSKASPESRERLTNLIAKAEAMTPEKLRAIRACEVLEKIGTVEAKALLAEWAKGPGRAMLAREAAESLERLRQR
jgi:WD40 repeat protein